VYVAGPANPGKLAVICVFDIFGFKPQTQQGADILAEELGAQVYMPDFFEGDEPWTLDKFPPTKPEDQQKFQEWFAGFANPANHVPRVIKVAETLKSEGVQFIVTYGFCWGGKVALSAATQPGGLIEAVSCIHPAMLSAADYENLNVPVGLFISNDEPTEEFEKIQSILAKKPFADKNSFKHFDSFHGFAAARANLDDADNKAKYESLYKKLLHFTKKASGQE
ncbi:uncharacterized protein PHACADRAFT_246868, partial [Phanerochaete carnosa HHB-10118-sp]